MSCKAFNKMKSSVSILLTVLALECQGQIVKGILLDRYTKEPVWPTNVQITDRKTVVLNDTTGHFMIDLKGYSKIDFFSISYYGCEIDNIPFRRDTIDLGEIYLFSCYPRQEDNKKQHRKKAVLTLCTLSLGCRYLKEEDLSIICESGKTKYVWEARDNKNGLRLDFMKMKTCAEQ